MPTTVKPKKPKPRAGAKAKAGPAKPKPAHAAVAPAPAAAKAKGGGLRRVLKKIPVGSRPAVAGAGITFGLFTGLGIGQVINYPGGFSPAYALAIFSVVAVFSFVAGVVSLQMDATQRGFARAGFALFGLIALVGASPFVFQAWSRPTITFSERFQPDLASFQDPDPNDPIKLQLSYYPPVGANFGRKMPFQQSQLVRPEDTVEIYLDGLDRLLDRYVALRQQAVDQAKKLHDACAGGDSPGCRLETSAMEDVVNAPPKP